MRCNSEYLIQCSIQTGNPWLNPIRPAFQSYSSSHNRHPGSITGAVEVSARRLPHSTHLSVCCHTSTLSIKRVGLPTPSLSTDPPQCRKSAVKRLLFKACSHRPDLFFSRCMYVKRCIYVDLMTARVKLPCEVKEGVVWQGESVPCFIRGRGHAKGACLEFSQAYYVNIDRGSREIRPSRHL